MGMNRISEKPLKTRDSGTLSVAGIPCLRLGLCNGSVGAVAVHGHSGQKPDPSVTPLDPCGRPFDPYGCESDPCGRGFDPSPCPI